MSERRKHPRYETVFKVKFRDEEAFLEEYGKNISKGGMFIKTDKIKDPGTIVHVVLTLPLTNEEVETDARVVHIVDRELAESRGIPMGMGVEFIDVTPEFEEKVKKCVEMLEAERIRLSDRRTAPRAVLKVALSIEDPQGSERLEEHYLIDFSRKGVFVKTPRMWPPGTEVKLYIEVPAQSFHRELRGKVKWSGAKNGDASVMGVGVEFELSEEEIRDVVMEVLSKIFER